MLHSFPCFDASFAMEAARERPISAVEVLRRPFDTAPGGRLYVSMPDAHLRLRGTADAHAEIVVSVTGAKSEQSAHDHIEALNLRVRQEAEMLRVTTGDQQHRETVRWRRLREAAHLGVRIDIAVPRRFSVDAHASGGTLDAAGLEGHHTLEVNGGRLRAEDVRGRLEVFARSSEVTLRNLDGPIVDVHARGSRLAADNLRAEALRFHITGQPARFTSIEGPVELTAAGAPVDARGVGGPLTARCYGAPLVLGLPSAADLHLAGPRIMLDSRLPFTGRRTPRRVEGRLQGGGPRFRVRALGREIHCLADS